MTLRVSRSCQRLRLGLQKLLQQVVWHEHEFLQARRGAIPSVAEHSLHRDRG